jgi:hypothetical protein
MASIKEMMLVAALAVSATCLMTASPALADDEDKARDACKQIAKNRDWKDVDTDLKREGDDRIVIAVQGERNKDDRERRCVYNVRRDEARFEDQRR